LVPYGPSLPPVPPTDRARKIADYFRVLIILHFVLAVTMFFGTRYVDGAFDLLGATVGYMSIRNPEAYNFQYLLCYVTYCGFVFIYAIVRMILFFAGSTSDAPSVAWQNDIYVGTLIAGPVIYVLATVIGYQLYKELRSLMVPESGAYDGSGGMGGPGYVNDNSDAWRHPEVHPTESTGSSSGTSSSSSSTGSRSGTATSAPAGFRAFTGQGHKLGGS